MPEQTSTPEGAPPAVLGVADAPASSGSPAPGPGRRGASLPAALVGLVAGLAVLVAAVLTHEALPVLATVVVGAVGLGSMYWGAQQVGSRLRGPGFDLALPLAATWLGLIGLAALFAPLLPLAESRDTAATLLEPSYVRPDLFSAHPLGTNNFGLDLFARVIHGARTSLAVAFGAIIGGTVLGALVGLAAGYGRGVVDRVTGIVTNTLLAIPPLILLIALATILEPNMRNLAGALALLALPTMVRVARANTMALAEREFVLAARGLGASPLRIMGAELLPNLLRPLASYAMVLVSVLIVAEASLSFLGLGIEPPEPSWGNMIAEGRGGVFADHPHVVLVPGAALFLTVFSLNLLAEKARSRWGGSSQEETL